MGGTQYPNATECSNPHHLGSSYTISYPGEPPKILHQFHELYPHGIENGSQENRRMTWVYIRSEPGLYTVGFYSPDGKWHGDSDHESVDEAAKRVHYLNGGSNAPQD